jgi:tetratricopeptide (TPR) repeat protein
MELYEPVEVGPLEVAALSLTLPGLSFPLDLSGGVPVFRHRRGDLEHVELAVGLDALGRWLLPRVREVLGRLESPVAVWSIPQGLGVGLVGEAGALAFDLLWAPALDDARFVLARARGVGLGAPALGFALRAVDAALGGRAERTGRALTFPRAGAQLGRAVLPAIGARAPSAARVRFGALSVDGDRLTVTLDSTYAPPALTDDAVRALELAGLTREADEALARGDIEAARAGYVSALERAPRHPGLAQLVAGIDVAIGGRAEAALGMLVESMPATRAGIVGAELLAELGDRDAARDAILAAADAEPYAPVAALMWQRLSEVGGDAAERLEALDHAVARAPGLSRVRWARLSARLEHGDVEGALADAEHLEAGARGSRARHELCRSTAQALFDAGFVRDAGRLFERALRYLPDDAEATAGLARSLMDVGRRERAFALFERAIALGDRHGQPEAGALVDLARLLAGDIGDLPQAIARVREVPAASPRALEARLLEARWRSKLGDIRGASLAFGRLRQAVELSSPPDAGWAEWLFEAARFERDVQHDALAAERHLTIALRLAPRDRKVAEAYREVAAVVAARARHEREAGEGRDEELESQVPGVTADADEEPDELRVDRLRSALHVDPDNLEVVMQLAAALERLGRDHDLLALLSARLDDADVAEQKQLEPRLRALLERLRDAALAQGRESDAELYAGVLARLG